MKRKDYLSWDTYFMSIALLSAMRSKDAKTQTGACIINNQNKIISVGYNGLPQKMNDENPIYWNDENDTDIENSKHSYVIHAEANAIYNKNQASLENTTMYVSLFPCIECAKAIAQNSIKKVIYLNEKPHHKKSNAVVKKIFKECGVKLQKFEKLSIKDKEFVEKINNLN